jgi:hypothetical protein
MRLRDVELGDVSAYVRMRCDPVIMAELGGPLPREGVEEKVARDVQAAARATRGQDDRPQRGRTGSGRGVSGVGRPQLALSARGTCVNKAAGVQKRYLHARHQ